MAGSLATNALAGEWFRKDPGWEPAALAGISEVAFLSGASDHCIVRINAAVAYVILYASMYAAFGVASPFWPELLKTKALTSQQIGIVLAAAMAMRLAAGPLVGALADRSRSLRLVLASCAGLAAAMAAAILPAETFSPLLGIALVQAAALAPITSIADALSVNAARPLIGGRPFEYGWIRGSASAAFVAGTLVVGQLITRDDLTPVIWMNASLLLGAAAATALLPAGRSLAQPDRASAPGLAGLQRLLGMAQFRSVIAVSALVYGSHAMHDGFAVIRWSDAGIGAPAISLLWSEAVAAEVIVFFLVGPALLDHVGPRGAAVLAAAAGIMRWSVAGATTSVAWLSTVQPLHGLTFALLHLACMRMMAGLVPSDAAATAQAVYAFGSGVVTTAITLLSSVLYARYGGASFAAMALLCAIALPWAWFGFTPADQPVRQAPH
jgi:MFS transporter, PPP family, 3-phenylpropionic acid transporter